MSTINQLVRNPRKPKLKKPRLLALKLNFSDNGKRKRYYLSNNPQKRGLCKRVGVLKPKKPNSANRAYTRAVLSNKKEITIYIPGEKHNLSEYSSILTSGRGAKDLPGVKYRVIRGCGDAEGVKERKQGRSLYGTKKGEKRQ